jgi:hypothetical protein
MKAFDEARETFGDAMNVLPREVNELESSEERDEALQLATIAELRRQYCIARAFSCTEVITY